MKIVIMSHYYPSKAFTYAGIFVHEQAKALQELGIDVRVIRPIPFAPWPINLFNPKWQGYASIPHTDIIESINVSYPRYISYSTWRAHTSAKRYYKGFLDEFKRLSYTINGIDLIHAHFVIPDGLAATYIGSKFSIPVVITAHGSDVNSFPDYNTKLKRIFSDAIMRSAAVVTVSNALKKKVEMYGSPRYVQHIPMGVDTRVFKPVDDAREIRERIGIPLDAHLILFVGSPVHGKGIFDLIQAFEILRRNDHNAALVILGDASSASGVISHIQCNNLADAVKFVGAVPHEQVKNWMSACDVFVLPSYSEGLPTVVVEAMACGCAVVATPVGGVPEILRDGENGIIIPVKDPKVLAEKLSLLIGNPTMRKIYGKAARETVINGYDVMASAKRLINLYNEILYK